MTGKQDTTDDEARKWREMERHADRWLAENAGDRSDVFREEVKDKAIARCLNEGKNRLDVYLERVLNDAARKSRNKQGHERSEDVDARGGLSVDPTARMEAAVDLAQRAAQPTANVSFVIEPLRQLEEDDLLPDKLLGDIGMLADSVQHAANRRPDDQRLWDIAAILWAVSHPKFEQVPKLAGIARHWLEGTKRAPTTRAWEANGLRDLVTMLQVREATPEEAASQVVRRLRSWPLLSGLLPKTLVGLPWESPEVKEAVARVAACWRALEGAEPTTPETLARAVLRALDAPESKVKALFDSKRKAKVRKKLADR